MPPLPPPDRLRLASLRKLLASADADEVTQGLHLLDALGDPVLLAAVGEGLTVRPAEFPRPHVDDVYDTQPSAPIGFVDALHLGADPETDTRTREAWIGWHVRARHRGTVSLHVARSLGLLDDLRRLAVVGPVRDFTALEGLPALEELWIIDGSMLDSLAGLSGLSSLRTLQVRRAFHLVDLGGLQDLPSLEALSLTGCPSLRDLDGLRGFPHLKALDLTGNRALTDVTFLRHVPNLERLTLREVQDITDWGPLTFAPQLRALDLGSCAPGPDIGILAELRLLEELDLSGTDVPSLAPFRALPALRVLRLRSCNELVDVRGLVDIPCLEEIDLSSCWKLPGRYQNRLTMEQLPAVRAFFRDPRARLATLVAPLLAAESDDGRLDTTLLRDLLRSLGDEPVVGGTLVPLVRAWARERLSGIETGNFPPDPFKDLPDADELPF